LNKLNYFFPSHLSDGWVCTRISPYFQERIIENARRYYPDFKFYCPRFIINNFSQPVYPDILYIRFEQTFKEQLRNWLYKERKILEVFTENGYIRIYRNNELPESPEQRIEFIGRVEIITGPFRGLECEIKQILKDAFIVTLFDKEGINTDIFLRPIYLGLIPSSLINRE
jgi:hypothetical protein